MTPEEREAWWGRRLTITLAGIWALVAAVALVAGGWVLARLGVL